MEMSSKNPLKHTQLARLLRPSTLLKSSCNSSSSSSTIFTSSTNMGSSRSLSSLTTDDPLLLVRSNSRGANSSSKLDRPPTFSSSLLMLSLNCHACRPTKALEDDIVAVVKKERRKNENSEFYETGEKEGRTCPHASPSSPSKNYYHFDNAHEEKKVQKGKDVKKKKKFFTNAYGFSSSTDNDNVDDENGSDQLFSSDETEAFLSSRSFSSDSSEFYKSSRKKKKSNNKKKDRKQRSRIAGKVYVGFKPIVSVVEKERRIDGIPVIKRSRDPYVDFRDSMVEMIVERQILGGKNLEKLLHSYLSLNSPLHHSVIIRAFADIYGVMSCQ